jgi:hypothetical protein
MVVVVEAESLAGTSSDVDDETRTLLTTEVAVESAGTLAVTVNAREAALAMVPAVHVTTCPLTEQELPGGAVALTKVTPAGSVSITETPVAVLGPLFVTVIGYCTVPPALTDVGDDDFVTARSASADTGVDTALPV